MVRVDVGVGGETVTQDVPRTSSRLDQWTRVATLALIAGACAWLVKLVVILMTDGAESGAGDVAAAVFFLPGLVLLVIGSSAVGLWLTRSRQPIARIVAGLLAPVAFLVSMNLLDPLGEAMVGDLGPDYAREEAGILLAALLWLALGLLVAAGSRPRRLPAGS